LVGELDRKEKTEWILLYSVEIFGTIYLGFNPVPKSNCSLGL
jgi:hypothetical protein